MKRHIFTTLVTLLALVGIGVGQTYVTASANNSSRGLGVFYASNYAFGLGASPSSNNVQAAKIDGGNSATGSSTITVSVGYIALPDGRKIVPFSIFAPIIVGGQSNFETVTPTAVSGCQPVDTSGATCNITASFSNLHSRGEPIASASFGLQEAIDDAYNAGGGVVSVDTQWVTLGGTISTITGALTFPQVSIRNDAGQKLSPLPWFTVQASNTTAFTAPTTRVGSATACTGSNTVCDTSVAVASGGFTNAAQYVCVTVVNNLGGESPCSATAHYTSAGAVQIEFLSPAAATGAVGWRPYIGLSYATAYLITPTAAICTLTTLETVIPACAITNATYGQTGSNAFISKPATTTQLPPQSGGVAAAYNPNTLSWTTAAYQPAWHQGLGFPTSYTAFPITGALTAGQAVVMGTIPLPAGVLNYVGSTLHISFDLTSTPSTGGTANLFDVEIGDITDFTTGTPKVVCIAEDVTASGTAAINVHEECDWVITATGTTGSITPGGFGIEQVTAGGTIGNPFGIPPTAVTADVLDQDSLFFVYAQTSGAESTTPPQLQSVRLSFIN